MRLAHASIDFETASSAGIFATEDGRLIGPPGAGKGKKGLSQVGAACYAQHPSTRVLWLSYKLPTGFRARWHCGQPYDVLQPLFDWIARGGRVGAHNLKFEWWIWQEVCVKRLGWPPLHPENLTCSMATANVNGLPGALKMLATVLPLGVQKDTEGDRLIKKFSIPNKPTKKRPGWWWMPEDDWQDFLKMGDYCDTDTDVESAACHVMPPMTAVERAFWIIDQRINRRGIAIDRAAIRDCLDILGQVLELRGEQFRALTGLEPTQLEKFKGWLAAKGVFTDSLDEEHLEELLERPSLPAEAREALEIRALIGSASVKKLFAMENQCAEDNRLHDLIIHHGARTGRPTGEGPQPLNLPKNGAKLATCGACSAPFHPKHASCPWCGQLRPPPSVESERRLSPQWRPDMVEPVLDVMRTRRLDAVEHYYGDAVPLIMGLVRALFWAEPGYELIASDYSAIEAVVTAFLAGEEWRQEVFLEGKPIYLMSAAKITGKTLEFYEEHKARTGGHHPDRQYVGKVAELALGFGGWIGAWRNFDSSDKYTDEEVKKLILNWRQASPAVVQMWGGQSNPNAPRFAPEPSLYGFEGAAHAAVTNPGQSFTTNGVTFYIRPKGTPMWDDTGAHVGHTHADALIIRLLSGRELTYWEPMRTPSTRDYDPPWVMNLSYMTWNTNPKYGPKGWVRMQTYGGRLTENIVQATAHDILRYAIVNLEAAGYPAVLHVYDEIIVEVPVWAKPGALEEVERIMGTMPPWCAHWPVKASGGWRGRRYRKE